MKKLIILMMSVVMCLSIAVPALAAQDDFVPSITYKSSPKIVPIQKDNGEEAFGVIRDANEDIIDYIDEECLYITPVAHIWDEETEVPADVEQLLTFVYEGLTAQDMELPYDKFGADLDAGNMVIRDLFDARWSCEDHEAIVGEDGNVVEITFDLGIAADVQVYAMSYDEEAKEWSPIFKTVNNGDGTVTCFFEHFCAIAFSVPLAADPVPAVDGFNFSIIPWIIVLIVCAGAVVFVLILKNKRSAA